jgi:signal peptide peptidase SppA
MKLPHLASRLYGTPLLLTPTKLDIILAVLGDRIDWNGTVPQLARAPMQNRPDMPPGIAVIPIHGTLVRRSLGLAPASGLLSYDEIATAFDTALHDPAVEGILLDIDSPGGEAGGVFDLARKIRTGNTLKPVWAIASDAAFSAAYALAAAAERLVVTETSGIGSIGVIAMHVDQSARDAMNGYRYTAITAGDHKNDLSPHEPLDSDAQLRLQQEVDRLYELFVAHIAAMRRLSVDDIKKTEAGLYFGNESLSVGLADEVLSFEQGLQTFSSYLLSRRQRNPAFQTLARSAESTRSTMNTENTETTHATETTETPPHPAPDNPVQDTTGTPEPDPVAAAIQAARHEALAIAQLCQLAGQPERIAAFLAAGMPESEVRQRLMTERAASAEIVSRIHPDAQVTAADPESGILISTIKKLIGKE